VIGQHRQDGVAGGNHFLGKHIEGCQSQGAGRFKAGLFGDVLQDGSDPAGIQAVIGRNLVQG